MYTFPECWTDRMKINFLQRVVLIHSYLYYERNDNMLTDAKYDEISRQLVTFQNGRNRNWVKNKTQYGYVFLDFDGNTGFDLYRNLKRNDRRYIKHIAEKLLKG